MTYKTKHLPLILFGAALTPIAAIELITVNGGGIALAVTAFLVMVACTAIVMGSFNHMKYIHRNK